MRPWASRSEICVDANGLALGGIDPLSYFAEGAPARGKPEHALVWRGAVFHFGGTLTQRLFLQCPERFAPQYGGHCALAMALGDVDEGDPSAWQVARSKLYLFGNAQAAALWGLRPRENVRWGNTHWTRLLHEFALR
jgi:hypothetical protein